jgi:hypothetical protein
MLGVRRIKLACDSCHALLQQEFDNNPQRKFTEKKLDLSSSVFIETFHLSIVFIVTVAWNILHTSPLSPLNFRESFIR